MRDTTPTFQLATRLPDYRKLLLTLPEIAELDRKDAAELFDYLLANPLRSVIHGGRERYWGACLKTTRGPAARDFDWGQGGEAGASPERAVTAEPTPDPGKRPAAWKVLAEKTTWLRCSSVTDHCRVCSLVAPRHAALSAKTGPLVVFKQTPIVIDALDEAGEAGRNPLVEMLARNAQRLPDWLGLVVTSRPEFDVKTPLQALNPFPLDTQSESNRADSRDEKRKTSEACFAVECGMN